MTILMQNLMTTLLGLLPREGETVRTGKRGRPAFRCTFDAFLTNYAIRLPLGARAALEAAPFAALEMLNVQRRELNDAEKEAIVATQDSRFQDLRDGEPIQRESRAVENIAFIGDESFTSAANRTLAYAIAAAKLRAADFGTVHTVVFERWAVCRAARPGSVRAEKVPASLQGLPARFQGSFYVSDGQTQGTSGGFLTFALVYPSGRIELLAKFEDDGTTVAPAAALETKAQRDARVKREKRAAAKAEKVSA